MTHHEPDGLRVRLRDVHRSFTTAAGQVHVLRGVDLEVGAGELVVVRGVNHVLLPALTGEVSEYQTLTDRNISNEVTSTVGGWLTRTMPEARER